MGIWFVMKMSTKFELITKWKNISCSQGLTHSKVNTWRSRCDLCFLSVLFLVLCTFLGMLHILVFVFCTCISRFDFPVSLVSFGICSLSAFWYFSCQPFTPISTVPHYSSACPPLTFVNIVYLSLFSSVLYCWAYATVPMSPLVYPSCRFLCHIYCLNKCVFIILESRLHSGSEPSINVTKNCLKVILQYYSQFWSICMSLNYLVFFFFEYNIIEWFK